MIDVATTVITRHSANYASQAVDNIYDNGLPFPGKVCQDRVFRKLRPLWRNAGKLSPFPSRGSSASAMLRPAQGMQLTGLGLCAASHRRLGKGGGSIRGFLAIHEGGLLDHAAVVS